MNAQLNALDGGDPRHSTQGKGIIEYSQTELRKLHDPSVTFEEYLYWAKITREEQDALPSTKHPLRELFSRKKTVIEGVSTSSEKPKEKIMDSEIKGVSSTSSFGNVSENEWSQASRALRTASWSAVFYLITTDVLGPYSVPWALAQMGYGPGVALYTVFGLLAGYTGWQLWKMFLMLDSYQWPMKTYGDYAFRIYGTWARHGVNVLQSIQLIFNVGIIIIGNGQGIYQINPKICYIICSLVWAIAGMFLGQIRTLQKFGWIANLSIWLNLVVLIMTMAVVAHTLPNYDASADLNDIPKGDGIVHTYAGSPPYAIGFTTGITGLMQAVYSYGGAMLFCEFMSEMRKPWDFWKSLICAQTFIYVVYLFFGVFVYAYQGQYTINPANQGMAPKAAYTAGNIISFISSLIAAALYGNIGIKVLYQNILKEMFGFPDLDQKTGKLIWAGMVPIYWSIAFLIASAIPNFSALSALVAALCILQFTYTFPPLLMLGAMIKRDAIQTGEGFDPNTGNTIRHDTGLKRWTRGYMKNWHINTWNFVFCLGALVTAGLGCYSAIESLMAAFAAGHQTAFSCSH